MREIKVGDKVQIAESSVYYNKSESNPKDVVGVVEEVTSWGPIYVDWDNGTFNIYDESDLEPVGFERTNKGYPNKRDCEHGSLRGSCETCDYEQEIAELKSKIAELKDVIKLVHKDLLMRAEVASDGCKVVNLSASIWDKLIKVKGGDV